MNAAEQAALVAWIWAQPGAQPPASLAEADGRGLSAYREHAKALAVRALAAAYPRLQAWMGEADFAGLAWAFARAHPPRQGDMNRWGAELADFLAGLPGMEAEPPALAGFDWHLHRIASAADDPPQDPALWTQLAAQDPTTLRLHLSPLLRCFRLPPSLDGLLRDGAEEVGGGPAWASDWLAWRAGWRPAWAPLPEAQARLLAALQTRGSLATALQALPDDAAVLGPLLQRGWNQGWLLGLLPATA